MARRTTIDVDEDRLQRAQKVLGTSGLKDTVDAAFDEVIRMRLVRELIEQLRTQEGIELSDDVLHASKAW